MCQTLKVRWDEDVWDAPNPKRKSIYTSRGGRKINNLRKSTATVHSADSEVGTPVNSEIEASVIQSIVKEIDLTYVSENIDENYEITETNNEDIKQECVNSNVTSKENIEDVEEQNGGIEKQYESNEEINKSMSDLQPLQISSVVRKYDNCLSVSKINIENTSEMNLDEVSEDKDVEITDKQMCNSEKENHNPEVNKRGIKEDDLTLKINSFLENIQKRKLESTTSTINMTDSEKSLINKSKSSISLTTNPKETKSMENRFKAQKEIIEKQRQKLFEQQKLIEELKLKKIHEDAKKSLEKSSKIYQETAINSQKLRFKARFVKDELKTETTESTETFLTLKSSKAPKIVQEMEKRAKEREERRLLIKERKRLLDEEKKRIALELINKKKQEEQEEKEKRLQALKEEREAQRQLELQKKLLKIKYLEQSKTALLHYKKKLLEKMFESLKNAIEERKMQEEIAVKLHEFNTTLYIFRSWQKFTTCFVKERQQKADKCFRYKAYKRVMKEWKKVNNHLLGISFGLHRFLFIFYL